MKTLYIDCGMGAAGDMLSAALWELLPNREQFLEQINRIGLPNVTVCREPSIKCGITGSRFVVKIAGEEEGTYSHTHGHSHSHGSMDDICCVVAKLAVPNEVKLEVLAIYQEIAQAESKVHGVSVEQVHFHEVGAMDALADITAVCLMLHCLQPDQIIVSPIHVGSGSVRCAHGILPVPAPATARILRGVPIYGGEVKGELCTPTGAALLKHFADGFGPMPVMAVSAIGYGMGKKDFERANCIRVLLGETGKKNDEILQLSCNVDDMTGEEIGFAMEQLLDAGALDVYTQSIGMKKSRPGTMICVFCLTEQKEQFAGLLFRWTTTLGVRETVCRRYVLDRKIQRKDTVFGSVRQKTSTGYGVERTKWEYEDIARIASQRELSLAQVRRQLDNDRT